MCYCSFFLCSPTSDGSAAALVCSETFVRRHGLEPQAVEIVAQEMRTDFPSTFTDSSCIKVVSLYYCVAYLSTIIIFEGFYFCILMMPFMGFVCYRENGCRINQFFTMLQN